MMPPPGSKKMPMPDMKPKGMPPPGTPKEPEPEKPEEGGGKHTAEEALVVQPTHHCQQCKNYDATSGECAKVEGYFEPESACLRYFEAGSGEDDDESGEDPAEESAETPAEEGAEG